MPGTPPPTRTSPSAEPQENVPENVLASGGWAGERGSLAFHVCPSDKPPCSPRADTDGENVLSVGPAGELGVSAPPGSCRNNFLRVHMVYFHLYVCVSTHRHTPVTMHTHTHRCLSNHVHGPHPKNQGCNWTFLVEAASLRTENTPRHASPGSRAGSPAAWDPSPAGTGSRWGGARAGGRETAVLP